MKTIKWRVKEHVGAHYHGNIRYESGDTFEGPANLSEVFPDKLEPATDKDAVAVIEEKGADEKPMAGLRVVPRDDGNFDVVNTETGQAINDEPLSRDAAFALVADTEEEELVELKELDKLAQTDGLGEEAAARWKELRGKYPEAAALLDGAE